MNEEPVPTEAPQVAVDFLTGQPYAQWAEIRESGCPVARSDAMSLSDAPSFQVLSYDAAVATLRDWETFSSQINLDSIGEFMGELIVGLDGAEHRAYRNVVAHAFRRSQIEHWERDLVAPTIHALLDEIAPLGHAELVRSVTGRYPVHVICGIVGVPVADADQMHQWANQINIGPLDPEAGHAASQAMQDYLQPLVDDRRANPRDDLLSDLVHTDGAAPAVCDGSRHVERGECESGITADALSNGLEGIRSQLGRSPQTAHSIGVCPFKEDHHGRRFD